LTSQAKRHFYMQK